MNNITPQTNSPSADSEHAQNVGATQSCPNADLDVCNPDDPFDPVNVRLSQETISGGKAKKLLTHVPVWKPNKLDFIHVHSHESYRVVSGLLEDKENREFYLISPDYYPKIDPAICGSYILYLTINLQGILFCRRYPDPSRKADKTTQILTPKH